MPLERELEYVACVLFVVDDEDAQPVKHRKLLLRRADRSVFRLRRFGHDGGQAYCENGPRVGALAFDAHGPAVQLD